MCLQKPTHHWSITHFIHSVVFCSQIKHKQCRIWHVTWTPHDSAVWSSKSVTFFKKKIFETPAGYAQILQKLPPLCSYKDSITIKVYYLKWNFGIKSKFIEENVKFQRYFSKMCAHKIYSPKIIVHWFKEKFVVRPVKNILKIAQSHLISRNW